MKAFFKTKAGVGSAVAFIVMMGLVLQRVVNRRHERAAAAVAANAPARTFARPTESQPHAAPRATAKSENLGENAAYLERYYDLDAHSRLDHDAQGNRLTRRETAASRRETASGADVPDAAPSTAVAVPLRTSLRLQGRATAGSAKLGQDLPPTKSAPSHGSSAPEARLTAAADPKRARPQRFNPYGRVIKCELVFTIDSTSEQCPLVGVVMEPVYNNGALIIPAGAEFHGLARPDRLRDRIFSGQDWVLVFPREPGRLSGRQLNVKGVALDRVEPDANGMTWDITDGSYGLEGRVIRTMDDEEIKRFVATFLAGSSVALQDRNTDRTGQQTVRNTPQNAVLQGLAANFEKIAEDISAEIAQHGVFIRVPAGHQFYVYPMQVIDPDVADISSDVAIVK